MSDKPEREAYIDLHRVRICAWVKANGIDPNDVPLYAWVRIEGGDQIACPVWRRNAEGKPYLDEETGELARGLIVRPLVAEPGETVARWLLWPWPAQRGAEEE